MIIFAVREIEIVEVEDVRVGKADAKRATCLREATWALELPGITSAVAGRPGTVRGMPVAATDHAPSPAPLVARTNTW